MCVVLLSYIGYFSLSAILSDYLSIIIICLSICLSYYLPVYHSACLTINVFCHFRRLSILLINHLIINYFFLLCPGYTGTPMWPGQRQPSYVWNCGTEIANVTVIILVLVVV